MSERRRLLIQGAVQGVGFRPFIYRLAAEIGIRGWVSNSAQGVLIEAEAPCQQLDTFLAQIEAQKPPHSLIQRITVEAIPASGATTFEIRQSSAEGSRSTIILPDLATCPDCLREIFDPTNRRYHYPFTNCTHCGPRYSIIQRLPYDRPNTTMHAFVMCDECRAEYENPLDRRFHAQPNACPNCGPQISLWDQTGEVIARDGALQATVEALLSGAIVALKGIGGFQLLVDARQPDAVRRLRERKQRPDKPFAVMFPTLDQVRAICHVAEAEEALLCSSEAPIVLLRRFDNDSVTLRTPALNPSPVKREGLPNQLPFPVFTGGRGRGLGGNPILYQVNDSLCADIAPGNPNLGVMLPYTPLHHLLMAELGCPVVATSGNLSGEPICIDEYEALSRLNGIADYFLIHNRPIARPVDDSVVRVVAGTASILRRARGYAPLPIELPDPLPVILATGAHLKNTVAVSVGQQVILSQHIGDLETPEAVSTFQHAVKDLQSLYDQPPALIACDLHPDYRSTQLAQALAEQSRIPLVRVQHHYAHILACMAEHRLTAPVLGVAWDGTGYGTDGTIWGGEFLEINDQSFERYAYLRPFRLPGGEQAIREPRRAALGLLFELYGDDLPDLPQLGFQPSEFAILKQALAGKINAPLTSSMGRLFDAVAALLGLRQRTSFEGQAAMDLEFACDGITTDRWYPFMMTPITIDTGDAGGIIEGNLVIKGILDDLAAGLSVGEIAAAFHKSLVELIVAIATQSQLEQVVLSGGCFQNERLLEASIQRLQQAGFRPYWSQKFPPNDGGIALGQIVAAQREYQRLKNVFSSSRKID